MRPIFPHLTASSKNKMHFTVRRVLAWLGPGCHDGRSASLSITTTYEMEFKIFPSYQDSRNKNKEQQWLEEKLARTPENLNRRQSLGLPGLDFSSLWAGSTDISRAGVLPAEGKRLVNSHTSPHLSSPGWEPRPQSTARLSWSISPPRSWSWPGTLPKI